MLTMSIIAFFLSDCFISKITLAFFTLYTLCKKILLQDILNDGVYDRCSRILSKVASALFFLSTLPQIILVCVVYLCTKGFLIGVLCTDHIK